MSFYLDAMAENWDALVLDDYEAVMPLTWKNKLGIKYLYQPAFIQQGGIFFSKDHSVDALQFLEEAMKHFKFAEITLNYANAVTATDDIHVKQRNNFILRLDTGYETVYGQYDNYIRQRIRRAQKNNLTYTTSEDIEGTVQLYRSLYGSRLPGFADADYEHFTQICHHLNIKGTVIIREAKDSEGKLVAAALLLKDRMRIYNIISCILPEGKKLLANYFLYDQIIKEHAGTGLMLDFEGSDVKGIEYFYKKFADANQTYPFVKVNRLPALIKLIKK
jgi:hypothetical protein